MTGPETKPPDSGTATGSAHTRFDVLKYLSGSCLQICSVVSIVSLSMICFVLALSTRPTTTKAHLGTKIFVVNLMLIEMVHVSCQLYMHAKQALPELLFEPWYELIGEEGSRWKTNCRVYFLNNFYFIFYFFEVYVTIF